MLWFVMILAVVMGSLVGLFTHNLKRALRVGTSILIVGTIVSLLVLLSGILGG